MKHIIAIGGGGFGRNPGEGLIEQYILDQTGKELPNICFIPTATGDNEAYKVNYYSTFSKLHCNPVHLDFFKRTPDLEKLIGEQDAIFVGGGNTKSMLAVWKDWGLDKFAQYEYGESMDEMKHADVLIQRILFLEGLPNMTYLGNVYIADEPIEILHNDLKLENEAIPDLREAILACEEVNDFVSRDLLQKILESEEEHVDHLETQLDLLDKVGHENFLQTLITAS